MTRQRELLRKMQGITSKFIILFVQHVYLVALFFMNVRFQISLYSTYVIAKVFQRIARVPEARW